MVIDLQGVGNTVTDPAVHCLKQGIYGKADLGKIGMRGFFKAHKCNEFCVALNIKDKPDIDWKKEAPGRHDVNDS